MAGKIGAQFPVSAAEAFRWSLRKARGQDQVTPWVGSSPSPAWPPRLEPARLHMCQAPRRGSRGHGEVALTQQHWHSTGPKTCRRNHGQGLAWPVGGWAGGEEEFSGWVLVIMWFLVLGDAFQKPYISGEADVASHELTGTEDYLLLACDGFFDSVPHEEVAGLVRDLLVQSGGSALHIAEELVAAARERGSRDNITVLVVFLRDPQELVKDWIPEAANA